MNPKTLSGVKICLTAKSVTEEDHSADMQQWLEGSLPIIIRNRTNLKTRLCFEHESWP